MRLPPPVIMLLLAAAMFGMDQIFDPITLRPISILFCGIFFLAGLCFLLPSIIQFIKSRTTINPYTPDKTSELVTDGVYRISRNPMYLAMALMLLAFALLLDNVITLIGVYFFKFIIDRYQIRFEEQALHAAFGEQFLNYKKQVRRWI